MTPELSQLQPVNVLNLRDQVKQQLRNAILSGVFNPGDRLIETAIADQIDVSRAPVREALSALEREGIVFCVPRRGYFVVDFTGKDIQEIYSLRLLLEIDALRRAVGRFTEKELAEMQHVVDEIGEAALRGESEKVVSLDLSFHGLICQMADHSRLYSTWSSLGMQTQILIGLTSRTYYDRPSQPRELHQQLLDDIRDKDLKRAEADLVNHLRDAQQRATEALAKLHASDPERNQ